MTQIIAYLNFDGNCREAMEFYKGCLGGELNLQTVAGSPMAAQCPTGIQDHILHGSLVKDGLMLMGSDMQPAEGFTKGDNIALNLNCSSEEEINRFFTALAEGGQIHHQLNESFWGSIFGGLKDKYGIRWMFNYEKNTAG